MQSQTYDVNSIQVMDDRSHVRKRIGIYLHSAGKLGILQLLVEIISNSVDEFNAGYGKEVLVHVNKDCSVLIQDNGRGIPVGIHPTAKDNDGNPIDTLTLICTTLRSGGKFNQDTYQSAIGVNGMGLAASNFVSEYMTVMVKRDGNIYQQKFERGIPTTKVEIIGTSTETGTSIEYKPDNQIFKQTLEPPKELGHRLKEICALNSGIQIHYINDIDKIDETYIYENGIVQFLQELLNNKPSLFTNPIQINDKNKKITFECAFLYDNSLDSSTVIKSYVNSNNTNLGGTHVNAFQNGLKDFLNSYAIKQKLIKSPLELKYYTEGLYAIVNVKMFEAELESQTKNRLNSVEVEEPIKQFINNYLNKNLKNEDIQQAITAIIDKAIKNKDADEAAKKARIEKKLSTKNKKQIMPSSLFDCINAGTSKYSEIFLTEGLSAASGAAQGRYSNVFQSVIGLRGKLKNVEKISIEQLLNAESIQRIITVLGCGIGTNFDLSKLRYDKVIILCFTGDTKVKMLDGTIKTFEELVELEKQNPDQDYWVYSSKPDGTIVPGKMRHPRITQYVNKVCKVTLDDGTSVTTTVDHRFMLRDGTYEEAQNLEPGMSLMPFYSQINDDKNYNKHREKIFIPNTGKWMFTHHMVMQNIDPQHVFLKTGQHIHHINENFLDNRPENLEWKDAEEHHRIHSIQHITEYNKSDEHRERVKELHQQGVYKRTYFGQKDNGYNGSEAQKEMLKKMHQREDIKQKIKEVFNTYNASEKNKETTRLLNQREDVKLLQKQGKIVHAVACLIRKNIQFDSDSFQDKSMRTELKKHICIVPTLDKIKEVFDSYEEMLQKAIEYEKNQLNDEMFNQLTNVEEISKKRIEANRNTKRGSMAKLGKMIIEQGLPFDADSYQKVKTQTKSKAPVWDKLLEYFESMEEFEEFSRNYNHKVVDVEIIRYDKKIPMYDFTVQDYHNFEQKHYLWF